MVNRFENITFKYCILHGRVVVVERNDFGHDLHDLHFNDIGVLPCYGPFTEIPPPPPLTEEEWEQIFEMKELV